MTPRYMLTKSDAKGAKQPIDCVTASCIDEAEEALTWLRRRHAERPELRLGEGEFFEILTEDYCPSDEWRRLTQDLERLRKARAEANSREAPRHEAEGRS